MCAVIQLSADRQVDQEYTVQAMRKSRLLAKAIQPQEHGEEDVAAARPPDAKDALDSRQAMQTASPSEHGGNHGGPALGYRCFALQHVVQRGPVVVGLGSHRVAHRLGAEAKLLHLPQEGRIYLLGRTVGPAHCTISSVQFPHPRRRHVRRVRPAHAPTRLLPGGQAPLRLCNAAQPRVRADALQGDAPLGRQSEHLMDQVGGVRGKPLGQDERAA
eukprot:scaffold10993_cov75-Phaeocystis_antarctica.AAC.2